MKPENILLHNNKIKLADFGFCEKISKNRKLYENLGSPLYMAPEILMNLPYDTKVDIYSLGCVLYNLTTGMFPFFENDLHKLMRKI